MNLKDKVTILGKYIYPNKDKIVEIIDEEGKIFWKERSFTVGIVSEDKNVFSFTNDPKLKVVFDENQMTEYYTSGKTMIYKRIKESSRSLNDLEALVGTYNNEELSINFELKLTRDNTLQFKLSTNKEFNDVRVYNQAYLQVNNFFLKVKEDQFNRVTDIILTYGRAKNIRFNKKTNLKFQPKIEIEDGSISVTTIGSRNGDTSDILLTKNYPNGNEIWSKRLGGSSWDKASSIIATEDGYLIIGSTSSYGNGNYDMYVIKTDKKGNQIWQNTYGDFYNEYGYSAEMTDTGYLIKGTVQNCTSNSDIFNRKCTTSVWFVSIDDKGKELSNEILESME